MSNTPHPVPSRTQLRHSEIGDDPDQAFVSDVAERLRCDFNRGHRAVRSTLSLLGQRLRPVDARAVAEQLPSELAEWLQPEQPVDNAPPSSATNAHQLLQRAMVERGLDAREVRAVCQVLAENLDEQARAHLRMQPLHKLFCAA